MKTFSIHSAALLGAALISGSATAQDNTLDTIVVSATRFEQPINLTPTVINTVTSEQIDASGISNISDLLKTLPGVSVRDAAGNSNRVSVSMRGFGQNSSSNVLIILNGRRLNNQTQEAPNLNLIALSDIEKIEVLQGSAGTLYGDQAVGGVINIVTKPITDGKGQISITRGSNMSKSLDASFSRGFDNGVGYRFSGSTAHADNYRNNSVTNFNNLFVELEKIYDSGRIFIEIQKTDDYVELPYSLSLSQKHEDRRQSSSSDYLEYDNEVLLLGLEQDLSDRWQILGEFSVRDSDGDGKLGGAYTQNTRVKTFNPRLSGSIGETDLIMGYDRHSTNYERGGFAPQTRKQEVDAVYTRAQFPLSNKDLKLTLGARQSWAKERNIATDDHKSHSSLVKEIGLSYALSDDQRIFIRRDESVRFANLDELAALPSGTTFLKPQESVSLELGWELLTENTTLQATVFKLNLDNEIKFFPATYTNENIDSSVRKGITLSTSHDYSERFTLEANYSYTEAKIKAGVNNGKDVPFIPTHMATVAANYRLSNSMSIYTDAVYTGSQYRDDDEDNDLGKLEDYTVVNTNFSWKHKQITSSIRVNNLFNTKYDAYAVDAWWVPGGTGYYPAAERQLMLTLDYDF